MAKKIIDGRKNNGGARPGSGNKSGPRKWQVKGYTIFDDGTRSEIIEATLNTTDMRAVCHACGFAAEKSNDFVVKEVLGIAGFFMMLMANLYAGALLQDGPKPQGGKCYLEYRQLPAAANTKRKIDEQPSL